MRYELIIEGKGGTIKLASLSDNDNIISRVDFLIAQEDLEAGSKANNLFNTLVIEGEIQEKTQNETRELLEWSRKMDQDSYRTVSLKIKQTRDVIRDYYLKEMFCVSYQEHFFEEKGNTYGRFVLKLRQRKGAIETIVVDC